MTILERRTADAPTDDGTRARIRAVMEKVRQIELRTRRLVNDAVAGHYHSVFRGRGLDFDSVREYVAGDEVRTIDWNVTARAGRPFVKQFREERELTAWILVDVSGSGDYGSGLTTKRELAAELACLLALSAVRNDDKVGLIMFSDRVEARVSPAKGRAHAMRIVREVLTCRPAGRGTDLPLAIELAGRLSARRSMMFLISDFELPGDREAALASLERTLRPIGARHDVVAIAVQDRHERTLPNLGLVTVEDAETGDVVTLDTGRRRVRERFEALATKRDQETRRALRRLGVDTLTLETNAPYLPALLGFFETRERRLG